MEENIFHLKKTGEYCPHDTIKQQREASLNTFSRNGSSMRHTVHWTVFNNKNKKYEKV